MAAKRSPILGYNHNVRYRGVVFHVQTEDSGLLNPHLFTHLFHEGVIVSTRKLVYDAGSNEDAIKALMQAQHKAVMKDLKKGSFDDKIDTYLGGTPGLEPRSGADPAAPLPRGTRAQTEQSPPPDEVIAQAKAAMSMASDEPEAASPIEIVNEGLSEPIELPLKYQAPPSAELVDPPTLTDSHAEEMVAAIQAANVQPARTKTAERTSRSQVKQTPPIGSPTARPQQPGAMPKTQPFSHVARDPAPMLELDESDSGRHRGPRDTAVQPEQFADATVPVRQPSHGAAALPPMKQAARPAMQSAVVQSRQPEDDLSAPVEIHAPAPPSVEPPPGERSERPGQYSVSRKEGGAPMREKTGRIAAINPNSIPALARPKQGGSGAVPIVPAPAREGTGPIPPRPQSPSAPQPGRPPTGQPPVPPPRVPTPAGSGAVGANRVHATAPIANRTAQPQAPNPASGVVMTRPAVIVGSPAKPPTPPATTTRVRKAREDEGRGFGQGLISEKSLDEVILAYLSEDAEDK